MGTPSGRTAPVAARGICEPAPTDSERAEESTAGSAGLLWVIDQAHAATGWPGAARGHVQLHVLVSGTTAWAAGTAGGVAASRPTNTAAV